MNWPICVSRRCPDCGTLHPELAAAVDEWIARSGLEWQRQSTPRLLKSAQTGIHRVRDIVTQLRSFIHHDQAQVARIDPVESIRTTIQMLNAELTSARVTVRLTADDVSRLTCRPARLNQAIYNVLRNAIQASPPEGVVDIRVLERDEQIVVRIEDQGPGIPAAVVSRIFEPFFTSREVGSGRGLGLSFTQRVIQDHQGNIVCFARTNGGTVFEISLPVHQDELSAAGSA